MIIAKLNYFLGKHLIRYDNELHTVVNEVSRRRRLDLDAPEDAYGPIADAAASLLTGDPSRVRKCEACPGQFYETSKGGRAAVVQHAELRQQG